MSTMKKVEINKKRKKLLKKPIIITNEQQCIKSKLFQFDDELMLEQDNQQQWGLETEIKTIPTSNKKLYQSDSINKINKTRNNAVNIIKYSEQLIKNLGVKSKQKDKKSLPSFLKETFHLSQCKIGPSEVFIGKNVLKLSKYKLLCNKIASNSTQISPKPKKNLSISRLRQRTNNSYMISQSQRSNSIMVKSLRLTLSTILK